MIFNFFFFFSIYYFILLSIGGPAGFSPTPQNQVRVRIQFKRQACNNKYKYIRSISNELRHKNTVFIAGVYPVE